MMAAVPAARRQSVDRRTELVVVGRAHRPADYADVEASVADSVASDKSAVVVDLSELEEIEPSLLMALVRAQRRLSWRNGRFAVVAGELAQSLLARTGLDGSLEPFSTRTAALVSVGVARDACLQLDIRRQLV
jgi:hypothetical protein